MLRPVIISGWKNDKKFVDHGYCFSLGIHHIGIQHSRYLRGGPVYDLYDEVTNIRFVDEEYMVADKKLCKKAKSSGC